MSGADTLAQIDAAIQRLAQLVAAEAGPAHQNFAFASTVSR